MLKYVNNELHLDGVPIAALAERWGTPLYVYSETGIRNQIQKLKQAFQKVGLPVHLHYSVKANPLLGILSLVKSCGEGFDTVSIGEIKRCLEVGAKGSDIVFSGSGKSAEELDFAIRHQIKMINVESESELRDVIERARAQKVRAQVALRVNPDVDALTHEYITTGTHDTKFGVSLNRALNLYYRYREEPNLEWVGLDMHIGSQMTEEEPIKKALRLFASLVEQLTDQGFNLKYLDIGGGLGIQYAKESVISETRFAELVKESLSEIDLSKFQLLLEPGRFIIAQSGVLIGRVLHRKTQVTKTFLILDCGMTELIRPALYEAHHEISAVEIKGPQELVSVVGPICESSDQFAEARMIPAVQKGDLVVLRDAGAYGVSMESTYNSRPRTPQVLLRSDGQEVCLRPREKHEDLWRSETKLS